MELKQENKDWIDAFMTTYPDGMSKSLARQTLESFIRKAISTARAEGRAEMAEEALKMLDKTAEYFTRVDDESNDYSSWKRFYDNIGGKLSLLPKSPQLNKEDE